MVTILAAIVINALSYNAVVAAIDRRYGVKTGTYAMVPVFTAITYMAYHLVFL